MSWRSWVDDCNTGILNDCNRDIPKKTVLTETGAAFKNYNKMMGTQENYMNIRDFPDSAVLTKESNGYLILPMLLILMLIILFLLKKNLLNIYTK